VVCAHWFINATAVTAMAAPRTIHDFYGFPPELFALEYPASGDPGLAAEIVDVVGSHVGRARSRQLGIDHGTWSVLVHAFPDATVPVIQLSIDANKELEEHVDLGARLAPLRERGVLIIGSGNVVHNLGGLDPRRPDEGFEWSHAFDDAAERLTTTDPGAIPSLRGHDAFSAAVPTPDHFLPLL